MPFQPNISDMNIDGVPYRIRASYHVRSAHMLKKIAGQLSINRSRRTVSNAKPRVGVRDSAVRKLAAFKNLSGLPLCRHSVLTSLCSVAPGYTRRWSLIALSEY